MSYEPTCLVDRAATIRRQQPLISLSATARRLGVHRRTLEAAIRAQTGLSPALWRARYLADLIISAIQDRPTASIKEWSGSIGCCHSSAFSHYCKRLFHKTPTALRRQLAGGDHNNDKELAKS
jgi:AraC-like DNA-binding protein